MGALLARSRFGVEAAALGRRAVSNSPAVRNGCQPAGPAGGGGSGSGNGGSGAGRQSAAASLAAFFKQHPEAAFGAIIAGGAFLFSEIRATRSELRSELSQTRTDLQQMEKRINRRMDRLYHVLIGRSGAPSGEAAPGDASGDDDDD